MRGQHLDAVEKGNLIGTPQQIVEQIQALEAGGVDELAAMSFISDTARDMARDMTWFRDEVMVEFEH
jgi:alkanesulfonate monooxygenase SsuD/methylene tetrahydromethanopterin reductase-like flavin-dependent oxidoreductase (luciferase family)